MRRTSASLLLSGDARAAALASAKLASSTSAMDMSASCAAVSASVDRFEAPPSPSSPSSPSSPPSSAADGSTLVRGEPRLSVAVKPSGSSARRYL